MKKLNTDDDYEDSGLVLYEMPIIYIPRFLEDLMYDIDDNKPVADLSEFSIFVKSKITGFEISLSNSYFIPKQRVHQAEVDYDEPRPNMDYNTVIHRHPDSMPKKFSAGDNEYINRNFDISILWTRQHSFSYAQYNLYANRSRCVIECDIEVVRPTIKKIKGLNKIQKYVYQPPKYEIVDPKSKTSYSSHDNPTFWDRQRDEWWRNGTWEQHRNADEQLNGSLIVDNDGNLTDYNNAINADEEKDDIESMLAWQKEVLEWFETNYPNEAQTATTLTVALVDMLNVLKPKYTDEYEVETTNYYIWMGIASYVIVIQKYGDKAIDVFGKTCARSWIDGKFSDVAQRVQTIVNLFYKHFDKGVTNANSGSNTKPTTTPTY